jgi:hypothetical protein
MIISEEKVLSALQAFLAECDRNELARLTGEIFGGSCKYITVGKRDKETHFYSFVANKDYMGAFDEPKESRRK